MLKGQTARSVKKLMTWRMQAIPKKAAQPASFHPWMPEVDVPALYERTSDEGRLASLPADQKLLVAQVLQSNQTCSSLSKSLSLLHGEHCLLACWKILFAFLHGAGGGLNEAMDEVIQPSQSRLDFITD